MPRKTKQEAMETRAKLLNAALDVFSEKGYSRTTLTDIAKRIGMTRGAVYWHFKDRQELLMEIMDAMFAKEQELVTEKVPHVSTLDDLKDYLVARAQVILENDDCRKFIFFLALQMEWTTETLAFTRQKLEQLQNAPFREIERVLTKARQEGVLREDTDIRQLEDILLGVFKGLVMHHLSGFASSDLPACVEMAVDTILRSNRAPEPCK